MTTAYRRFAVVSLALVAAACSESGSTFTPLPTTPTVASPTPNPTPSPPPPTVQFPNWPPGPLLTVTGTVYLRGIGGTVPLDRGTLYGWVEIGNLGRSTGAVSFGPNGQYSVEVPEGATMWMQVTGYRLPCVTLLKVAPGSTTRDVTVFNDPVLLGGDVPPDVIDGSRTLSGVVYTIAPDGSRQPVPGASVWLDGLEGMGVSLATTVSGADGRYLLCGLSEHPYAAAWASFSRNAYAESWIDTLLVGHDMTVDVELKRR